MASAGMLGFWNSLFGVTASHLLGQQSSYNRRLLMGTSVLLSHTLPHFWASNYLRDVLRSLTDENHIIGQAGLETRAWT